MIKTDSQLQLDVMNELKWEPGIDHERIGVSVMNGVVTLSGQVGSFPEKLLAETAARGVKGVKAIAEELMVRYPYQPKTSDPEIAKRVSDVMDWDPLVPRDQIEITVTDGVVKLSGKVNWNYQRDCAFKHASNISGVLRVENAIQVMPAVNTAVIKNGIEEAFERQADLEAEKISVSAEGHTVILEGKVSSWSKRWAAERAAWSAPGVSQIEDRLIVG